MVQKLGSILENVFLTYSDNVAVSDLIGVAPSLTYRDLGSLSKFIAQAINHHSQVDDRSIVITRRDPLGVAAITGCFLSQTIYIPIDADDPIDRISFILQDSGAENIICDDESVTVIDQLDTKLTSGINRINLNEIYSHYLNTANEVYDPITLDHKKCDSYMIYTSGTTGRPKGVLVAEGTLAPLLMWTNENSQALSAKKTLQYYSLGFDPSLLEIFSTLINGHELIICDHNTKRDLFTLISQIERLEVERLFLPISIIQLIAEEFGDRAEVFKSVREINCGGDRMVITATIRAFVKGINKSRSEAQSTNSNKVEVNNQYGPTEATIMVTQHKLGGDPDLWPSEPSIGSAVSSTELSVLDNSFNEVPRGEKGVLYIGGPLLAKGYWHNDELTAKNFVEHKGRRLYRTGDVVTMNKNGEITFYGREDHQIKINGLRIECSEVENLIKEELILLGQPCDEAVVLLAERKSNSLIQNFLAVAIKTSFELNSEQLKNQLEAKLPGGMVPSLFKTMSDIPLTGNGKIDRNALKSRIEYDTNSAQESQNEKNVKAAKPTGSEFLDLCLKVLSEISGLNTISTDQSIFEQSLTSLQAIKYIHRMNKILGEKSYPFTLKIAELYEYPKLGDFERYKFSKDREDKSDRKKTRNISNNGKATQRRKVAIVGMSCRFPEGESVQDFWRLIAGHGNGISTFTKEELTHPSQNEIKNDRNFVASRGILKDIDLFDAQKFMIPPRVAQVMDPQMRILLEESLKAIDNAVYLDRSATGVFYGMSNNTYIDQVEALHSEKCDQVGRWNLATLNEKDFIATQVAHKLNLMGPALSIHTACSTSLVAMVQAVRAIQNGDCDSALCGGIHIDSRHKTGHLYQEGSIFSKDATCRPYDENASGTIFSDGAGVVVLKDYDLALEEGNQILGVVVGCGLSNDGGDKTSFTAPSVRGQSKSIEMALQEAGITDDQFSFIEGHGTATPVGDPIELQALNQALSHYGRNAKTKIGLTSVKAQIGHTVAASGIGGVIKAVLCLKENIIPATVDFSSPNPLLDLENSPFVISSEDRINTDKTKRFCGISSFGVGGTNAHIIIEKGQEIAPKEKELSTTDTDTGAGNKAVILTLSGKTPKNLNQEINSLLSFIEKKGEELDLDALAKAMASKEVYSYRKSYVVSNLEELKENLLRDLKQDDNVQKAKSFDKIIFAAPGQGTQYAFLGRQLYRDYPVYKEAVDRCCNAYEKEFDINLLNTLFYHGSGLINFTQYTQPCLFTFQYAMLALLDFLAVEADFMIGHSVGEFALAAYNGLFSVEEAMLLIGKRGALMANLPAGKMLSIREKSEKVEDLIDLYQLEYQKNGGKDIDGIISIATVNSDSLCVVAGESEHIDRFATFIQDRNIMAKELRTSHAFHTQMMNSILPDFTAVIQGICLGEGNAVQIPTSQQDHAIQTREYWIKHITSPVNFKQGLDKLAAYLEKNKSVLAFDLGPRHVAGQLMKQNQCLKNLKDLKLDIAVVNKGNPESESIDFLKGIATAWEKGLNIDLTLLYPHASWCETPETSFDRQSYWAGYPLNKAYDVKTKTNTFTYSEKQPLNHSHEDTMTTFKKMLTEFIEDKSGFCDLPGDACFLELGLDSLLLTQISFDLKNAYTVEVSFRDLMDSLDTIDKLADFLVSKNPALNQVAAPAPTPVAPPAPVSLSTLTPTATTTATSIKVRPLANSGDLGVLIQGQMDLMRMHLELMSGGAVTSATSATPEAPVTTQAPSSPASSAAQTKQSTPVAKEAKVKKDDPTLMVKGTVNTAKEAFGAQARVNTISEVSEEKIHESVDEIIRAYCEKTPKSKVYTQKYRKVNADPRVVTGFRPEIKEITYPIVVNRSKDQHLWDIDGNEYVDVTCGFGSNFFGNQNERITRALHDQFDRGFEIGPQHELAGECAQLLHDLTGNERSGFCNTGSEAVLGALRVSRTITGRQKIVMFKGSYHGINDEVIVRGRGDGKAMPAAAGINPSATEDMILLDYGTDEALDYIRQNAKELAAVIVEPVQSRRTDFRPKAFLQEIRKITEESGTAFIFDEVITGFRIAMGGAQEYFGIRADLVTYGKIIGGGMPIGVVSGKARFMDALDGGDWQFGDGSVPTTAITYFAGTFVRHPLALRALKEALLILKEGGKDLYFDINQKAQKFVDQLNLFSEVFGAPIKVDNFGGVLKPRFTDKGKNNDLFFALMRLEGVHCYDGFPWFVTLGHREGDLEFVQEIWKKCIIEMQSLGLFSKGLISGENGLGAGSFVMPPQNGSVLVKSVEGKPSWIKQQGSSKIV